MSLNDLFNSSSCLSGKRMRWSNVPPSTKQTLRHCEDESSCPERGYCRTRGCFKPLLPVADRQMVGDGLLTGTCGLRSEWVSERTRELTDRSAGELAFPLLCFKKRVRRVRTDRQTAETLRWTTTSSTTRTTTMATTTVDRKTTTAGHSHRVRVRSNDGSTDEPTDRPTGRSTD